MEWDVIIWFSKKNKKHARKPKTQTCVIISIVLLVLYCLAYDFLIAKTAVTISSVPLTLRS